MGVDCRIYLPGNVRVHNVCQVIGKLVGLPATRHNVDTHPPGFVRVPNAVLKSTDDPAWVRMTFSILASVVACKWAGADTFWLAYSFECSHGSDRILLDRSNAFHIALFKGLAEFFGGRVVYNTGAARSEHEPSCDYYIPNRGDARNQPAYGALFWNLQQRIMDLKPLTEEDFKAADHWAVYKENGA